MREALKMEPRVGFLATAPGLLGPPDGPEDTAARVARPGSGMTDDRREVLVSDSEGEAGLGLSGGFVTVKAVSRTSFKNGFFVEESNARCSSGTVSLFFSMKPSTS